MGCLRPTFLGHLLLLFLSLLLPGYAGAMGVPLGPPDQTVECKLNPTAGLVENFVPGTSSYTTRGDCYTSIKSLSLNFFVITKGAYLTNTKVAQEKLDLFSVESGQPRGSVVSEWKCPQDPWLVLQAKQCTSVSFRANFQNVPEEHGNALYQLADYLQKYSSAPFSSIISPDSRKYLNVKWKEFQRSLSRVPAGQATGPDAQTGPNIAVLTPTVLLPQAGTAVVHGQLILKVQPPRIGQYHLTEIELTWLDDPQKKFVNVFSAGADQTFQGYLIPPSYIQPGAAALGTRWQVRVRMNGNGTLGPWSAPVQFKLVSTLPTLPTQSQKTSPILTTPQQGAGSTSSTAGAILSQPGGSPPQCKSGFVWRTAQPTDLVCAPPASRDRVKQENAAAASRRSPTGGPYGPNTCLPGFVWREAFNGDVVCVPPASRTLAKEENALSASRTMTSSAGSSASGAIGVLRRGVDEPGGPDGNQTVDEQVDKEKAP